MKGCFVWLCGICDLGMDKKESLWYDYLLSNVPFYDEVRYVIAAGRTERGQVRKVRASQGRMPDNVRWR